jgi:SAM-dependent methyltransferase
MSALVPGCGRAYDALALADHGFDAVVATDLSPAACEAAQSEIDESTSATRPHVHVRCGDFFELDGNYDLIWDNTFLCALDPSVRNRWAQQMKALIAPGGELITCVFPIGKRKGGPPYEMSVPLVRELLEPVGFEATLIQDNLPLEEQHRRPGDPLESALARGTALVTWRLKEQPVTTPASL